MVRIGKAKEDTRKKRAEKVLSEVTGKGELKNVLRFCGCTW